MNKPAIRILTIATAFAAAASMLTGCSGDVPMRAAENANDPACADVIVRLPDSVGGMERRTTNAQSTGAWGEGAGVQLVCGIEPSGPTTDACINVNGVDWIRDDSAAPIFKFEAYGRNPGLAVYIDSEQSSGTDAIIDLSAVVQQLPQERKCTSVDDTLDVKKPQEG